MDKSPSPLPPVERRLLRWLLPRHDHEHLIGYYETGFREIDGQRGRRVSRRWLWSQILKAVPTLIFLKFRGETIMLKNYLLTALRNITRHKGYSFINIAGLSIGMACCLLIFLWVRHEWSFDRFHENAGTIHRTVISWPQGSDTRWHWRTPPPLAAALKSDFPEIRDASRFYTVDGILVEHNETRFKEKIGFTDRELFSIFTLPLIQGTRDAALSGPQSLVISKAAAQKYFGDEDPLGKAMVINDSLSFQVAAVLEDIPANSLLHCPILIPFVHLEAVIGVGNIEDWGDFGYNTFVQLEESSTKAQVDTKLRDYFDVIWENPDNEMALSLQPLTEIHLHGLGGGGPIVYIWIFSAIAVFILLIACINFMNLATARSATRAREIGVRKVVGADRRKLVFQFLSESILLSLISLIFALNIVALLAKPLARLAQVPDQSRLFDLTIIPVFLGITLLTGLLAGSYPAIFLSSFRPVRVLKGRQLHSGSPLFRKILVVFQFSVSVFLLVGLILISRQIEYVSNTSLGFNQEQVVYVPLNEELLKRYNPFRGELLRNTGISHVAATSNYVGQGPRWSTQSIDWEGKDPQDGYRLSMIYADYDFAGTFELEMAAGRFFSRDFETDDTNFVLNETAARAMGVEDPLGMELNVTGQEGRLIGILKDFNFSPLRDEVRPLVLIMDPQYYRYLAIKIGAQQVPASLAHIERVFKQFAPKYPFEYRFLDEVLGRLYQAEQRSQQLLRYFVLLAGFISCLGLFGLASFMAERRTKEIGIRKVLGASEAGIFVMLSRNFVRWVLVANLIAWPLAYLGVRWWLQNFAYRAPVTWTSFVLAGLISLSVALLTVSWQAVKIARANPARTLKYE
jgi:putative ABC transport system permease protein